MISPRFFSMMTSAVCCKAGATGAECWEHRKTSQVILQSLSPRSRLLLAILAPNMWICVRKTIHTITPRYLVSHNKCCASWKTQNMPCGGEYRSTGSHKIVGRALDHWKNISFWGVSEDHIYAGFNRLDVDQSGSVSLQQSEPQPPSWRNRCQRIYPNAPILNLFVAKV